MPTTIKISPIGGNIAPKDKDGNPISTKEWFQESFLDDDIGTVKCIAFSAADLKKLLSQESTTQLVLAKRNFDNKTTLVIAGVDNDNNLQVDSDEEHLVLIGTPISRPTGNDSFPLAELSYTTDYDSDEIKGKWVTHKYVSAPEPGSFEKQMDAFQEPPPNSNFFKTVSFRKTAIDKILDNDLEPNAVVFLSGFASYILPKDILQNPELPKSASSFEIPVDYNLQMPVELLIAFPTNEEDNLVLADPALPFSGWPIKWKPYNI